MLILCAGNSGHRFQASDLYLFHQLAKRLIELLAPLVLKFGSDLVEIDAETRQIGEHLFGQCRKLPQPLDGSSVVSIGGNGISPYRLIPVPRPTLSAFKSSHPHP